MTDATIVRADLEHLDRLAPLFDAYRVFYKQPSDLAAARVYLWERLRNLESVIFLALDRDRAVGFTQLYPSFSSVSMGRLWILYDLYVIREARRQGIGWALMARAQTFARESGATALLLDTAVDNLAAQSLYESLGYVRDTDFYHYELPL